MSDNRIQFTKMHGLGNDFVVLNRIGQAFAPQQLPIEELANRYMGIGFDQLLVIESADHADFFCRIFNADGSEAEQCGNGLRCVARYLHENRLCSRSQFRIATIAGIFPVEIKDYDHVQIGMGAPELKNKIVTIALPTHPTVDISILSLGNPHAILKVSSIDEAAINELGKAISTHAIFPHGANVGFMQIINPEHIRLCTFERGSGITFACGSNACAAVFAGIANGWLDHHVNIEYRYGNLQIEYCESDKSIQMTGPATHVFSGTLP